MPASRNYYLLITGIIVLFTLSNCSRSDPASHQYIRLTNKTNLTLAFAVSEADTTKPINISQRFSLAKLTNPLMQPGQSLLISAKTVNGHFGPGKTMKLFLYTVHDSMAYANNNLTISHTDLSERNFQIEIRNDDLLFPGSPLYYRIPVNKK